MAWPTSLPDPDESYSVSYVRTVHRSTFDSGWELTRPKFTRTRREWKVVYLLDNTQKASLVAFFEGSDVEWGGYSFSWTSPEGDSCTVRLVDDSVNFEFLTTGHTTSGSMKYWKVSMTLREE